jgi:hypothetical protein
MELTEDHEQDLNDLMQSFSSNIEPSSHHNTKNSPDDNPEDFVQALMAEFAHEPDQEPYFDAIYEDLSCSQSDTNDTDDEEEDLGNDDDDDGFQIHCDEESGDDTEDKAPFFEKECFEDCGVSNFCSHVATIKEDCSKCDHMRQLLGADSKDVSASHASSSAPSLNVNRMTDLQLSQRALTFNIYDFSVSYASFNMLLL